MSLPSADRQLGVAIAELDFGTEDERRQFVFARDLVKAFAGTAMSMADTRQAKKAGVKVETADGERRISTEGVKIVLEEAARVEDRHLLEASYEETMYGRTTTRRVTPGRPGVDVLVRPASAAPEEAVLHQARGEPVDRIQTLLVINEMMTSQIRVWGPAPVAPSPPSQP